MPRCDASPGNCAIFETARIWAYRLVRQCKDRSSEASVWLLAAIRATVAQLNAEYAEPLPVREADGIAASIHRWITTRSRMWTDGAAVYQATFTTIQTARGKKTGKARQQKNRQLIREALA